MEQISDASFLGQLLVLPANVRLDWKVIASYEHSSLFGIVTSEERKSFVTLVHVLFFLPGGSIGLRVNLMKLYGVNLLTAFCKLGSLTVDGTAMRQA